MLKRIVVYLICFVFAINVTAYAQNSISAESAIVIDAESGTVLYEKNGYTDHPMASTTKIMTCLIACESDRLDDEVTITKDMLSGVEGTLIYLKQGDKISLLDLVKGAMIASGNDAANAIAVYLGKSVDKFAETMNEKANELSMKSTLFVTPSGLDKDNHHSSAYDMALLSAYAVQNKTLAEIAKMKSAVIKINGKEQTLYNHNKLLSRDDNFIGMKTGYTTKAGRCLVSAYNYNGRIIICVTMNAPNDWEDHISLINSAKESYKELSGGDTVSINTVDINNSVIKCSYEYSVTVLGDIWVKLYYYPIIYSPLNAGDKIGMVEIYSGTLFITEVPLTADENI